MEKILTEAEKPNNPLKVSLEIEKLLENIPGTVVLKDIFETKLYLLKLRNPHLYYHSQKVRIVAYLLALMHGLPTRYADLLQYAGWVHDLSLLFVPVQMHHLFIKGVGLDSSWQKNLSPSSYNGIQNTLQNSRFKYSQGKHSKYRSLSS